MKSPSFWWHQEPTLTARLLTPLAILYANAAEIRGKRQAKKAYYPAVSTISIGNLTVGGAGKTPLTIWLAEHFAAAGEQVAIISRGYKGAENNHPTRVDIHTHTARQVGDEPLEMARHFANKPVAVWVCRNRPQAARRAEQAGATLLLLDDGFQRRDIARNINILAINGRNPWGNGLPLPAGPLRENLDARNRASFAIVLDEPQEKTNRYYGLEAYRLATVPQPETLAKLKGPLIAFAAIAHPEKFFETLRQANCNVLEKISFPDHHTYTETDLTLLENHARNARASLVTTAKDATKLPAGFAHILTTTLNGSDSENILQEINLRLR